MEGVEWEVGWRRGGRDSPSHAFSPPRGPGADAHQGLESGGDAHGDSRDDLLEVAHLAQESKQPKGPQDPQLLDP